jgi:hypothetical protein
MRLRRSNAQSSSGAQALLALLTLCCISLLGLFNTLVPAFTSVNSSGVSPLADIDLGASTDFEDFAAVLADSFEFLEQDRALFADGGFELGAVRALTPHLALPANTLR